VHFWNSITVVNKVVLVLDFAGIADTIAGVVCFIVWRRNKEKSDRSLALVAILVSILAGVLWTSDAVFSHHLSALQQRESDEVNNAQVQTLAQTQSQLTNALHQLGVQSNALAAADIGSFHDRLLSAIRAACGNNWPIAERALNSGVQVDFHDMVKQFQAEDLERLFAEPEASNSIRRMPDSGNILVRNDGTFIFMHFFISPNITSTGKSSN
jgi:hypothetical protein